MTCTNLNFRSQVSILTGGIVLPGSQLQLRQPWSPALFQGHATVGLVQVLAFHHLDALDDGADRVAERAAGAVVVVHLNDRET